MSSDHCRKPCAHSATYAKRFGLRIAILALVVGLSWTVADAAEKVVNVYNWSDYIDPQVLVDFTAETGIKVVYDVYDNNDIVETKLLAGGSGYDVVVPSDVNVAREIAAGVLLPLDRSKLPNLAHMWPLIMDQMNSFDAGNRYAVDYTWGTTGLGYNIDKVKERLPEAKLDSWALLFEPANAAKLADCGIYILDTPDDVIPAALIYLGLDPKTEDIADIERAGALIAAIRPYTEKFDSSEYINALANGDVCLVLGYSGDVLQARDRAKETQSGVHIDYILPKEGAAVSFDSFAIPADAPHPDEAHAFIDYMMRPDVAARNSNYTFYANGNVDSQPFLKPEVVGDPVIYPDHEAMQRLHTLAPRSLALQRMINRLWSDIKSSG